MKQSIMKMAGPPCDGFRLIDSGEDGFASVIRRGGIDFRIICSWGEGWDHVSVSLPNRCPDWNEMEWIKRLFFYPGESAMQLHVAESEHVNVHPYCLHIWRPQAESIPLPPSIFVGPSSGATP